MKEILNLNILSQDIIMKNLNYEIKENILQIKNMSKFLLQSIKNDKNLKMNDVYEFLSIINGIVIKTSEQIEKSI